MEWHAIRWNFNHGRCDAPKWAALNHTDSLSRRTSLTQQTYVQIYRNETEKKKSLFIPCIIKSFHFSSVLKPVAHVHHTQIERPEKIHLWRVTFSLFLCSACLAFNKVIAECEWMKWYRSHVKLIYDRPERTFHLGSAIIAFRFGTVLSLLCQWHKHTHWGTSRLIII